MSKQNFHTLLSRYRSGDCTDREKRLVERWFSQLDDHAPGSEDRSVGEKERLEEKIWIAIQTHERKKLRNLTTRRHWWWAAAILLTGMLGSWWFYKPELIPGTLISANDSEPVQLASGVQRTSTKDAVQLITLSDGTEVQLSSFSSLEYPSRFEGSKREVILTGKALFKVFRNPDQPFYVHSGEIVTKVLGTSFWIDGRDPLRAIEVSVVTGKVSVSKRTSSPAVHSDKLKGDVILTANQKVKFSYKSHLFETGLVDNPVLVVPAETEVAKEESFVFESTPITEVIGKLSRAYGIEIVLEDEAVKGCLFRGDITHQPLFTKLDLLCSAINASYRIKGTRVLVNGSGCALPSSTL